MIAFSSASSIGSSARWTRRRTARGSSCQAASTSASTSAPSGSSATARTSGPASSRCGLSAARTCSANAGQHAERILEPVPPRHLREQRRVEPERSLLEHLGVVADEADAPVQPLEHRAVRIGVVAGQAGGAQHCGHARERHPLVLRREGVDRRRDDHHARRSSPSQANASRENTYASASSTYGMRNRHASRARSLGRSRPMCARQMSGTSHAARSAGSMPGGLGVVEDHDVAGPHRLGERLRVGLAAALVGGALRVAQRPAVAREAVEPVVQALGDAEELGIALGDDPAAVEPGAAHVADQRAQHLGDAAAERGRVDVPDRAGAEQRVRGRDGLLELREALAGQHLGEPLRAQRRDVNALERHREPRRAKSPRRRDRAARRW